MANFIHSLSQYMCEFYLLKLSFVAERSQWAIKAKSKFAFAVHFTIINQIEQMYAQAIK